ncbi:hypothetical protein [Salininema proteolyticum]|uniref:Uncharacterized protein n=1 Tax=Salininema proteolyticum TaxID=1607685 RepID=A0ABV8TX78_9ACTN
MRIRFRRSWAWLFLGLGLFSLVWVAWLMVTTLENVLVVQLFASLAPIALGWLMLNRPYFYFHPHPERHPGGPHSAAADRYDPYGAPYEPVTAVPGRYDPRAPAPSGQITMAGLGLWPNRYPQQTCECQRLELRDGRVVLVYRDGTVEKTPVSATLADPEDFRRFTERMDRTAADATRIPDHRAHEPWIEHAETPPTQ